MKLKFPGAPPARSERRPSKVRRALAGTLALALTGGAGLLRAQGLPARAQVAAAANLQPALVELAALFESGQSGRLAVTYGASANLLRQIQQGLPAELFLSADEDLALRLAATGVTVGQGVVYATGQLALLVPVASPLRTDPQLAGLRAGLAGLDRFAIANPELAPYGRAALQALQKTGLWAQLQGKLVTGENIAQATQYVSSGAAGAGLTALSLALAPEVAARTRHAVIDAALHEPLRQRMVLLAMAGPTARAFYDFIQTPAARAVLLHHGYV
ncbi:MAG: molybdate ABC transporter substrate-binding protein [Polaromonas sp.]|nr:molybdate ABC transporter substrate-binding protein [Polaromonas sp.]